MNTATMKALYQNYNQAAAAQQMMTHTGVMPQQPAAPAQKKKVFAKLSNSERGFYANLFAQADKKGLGRIEGLEAVQFLKRSGLPKNILKDIWDLSAYSDPKFLNKDEFYVALKLIAYAQNKMDPTIDSVITNLPVALPSFKLSDEEAQQTKAPPKPQSTINVEQLPDLDQISPEMLSQVGPSSFVQKKQPQQQPVQQSPVGVPPPGQSPFVITQPELVKYNRIFENFDKTKKGFLEQSEAKEVFQKTKLSVDVLKSVWNMVDWMDRGILDKFAFIMALHLLHRCKTGVPLPSQIPQEMWTSFGQTGLNFMAQVQKMKEMKKQQQAAAASQPAEPQMQEQKPQADLLSQDAEPAKKEEPPAAEPQFMNLIEDAGFEIPKPQPVQEAKVEKHTESESKPEPPKDLFFFGEQKPAITAQQHFSPRNEQIQQSKSPVPPQIKTFEPMTAALPIHSPMDQNVISSSYSGGGASVPTNVSTGLSSGHMKALESQVDFLEQQASHNRQIMQGMQEQSSRMEKRMFELERYLEQLRQTIRTQSQEMRKEKDRLGLLSKEYDQKMKGYQDNLAQLQVINEQRRSIQEEIVKKEVGIAQANSNAQVAESYQNYDRKMSIDSYKYNQGYYNHNQYQQHQRDPSWQKSPNEAYSNNQMEWDNYNKEWNAQNYNQPDHKEEQFDFQMQQRGDTPPPAQHYEQPQEQIQEPKEQPPQYQNQYYQESYGNQGDSQQQQSHPEPAQLQERGGAGEGVDQNYGQNYYNQEVNTPQNNEGKQLQEDRGSRRSTVSKSWRFQMINQMQADEGQQDFQNFNQPAFETWNQDPQPYEQKQEKKEEGGFDMKFEGNFDQDVGGGSAQPEGFNFEWSGAGDQPQKKEEGGDEKKQEGGDDAWMDFQSNVQTGDGGNNGFGEGPVSFDFS